MEPVDKSIAIRFHRFYIDNDRTHLVYLEHLGACTQYSSLNYV